MATVRGEKQNVKPLRTDGSGRASFELDTSDWAEQVSLHVRHPRRAPLRRPGGGEAGRGFLTQTLPAPPWPRLLLARPQRPALKSSTCALALAAALIASRTLQTSAPSCSPGARKRGCSHAAPLLGC